MEIDNVPIAEIVPYLKNPRKNDVAVDVIAKSIKEFGFRVPVILDKDNVIIAGHTGVKAAQKIGLTEVPVIWADDLTEAQVKAFRIMDNKSHEYSAWDYELLKEEIKELKDLKVDLDLTGFKAEEINFFNPEGDGPANNPYEEWRKSGGTDYSNENTMGVKTILLHFKTEEDVREFSELVHQTITPKTKYLWFPKQPTDEASQYQYEE